jgi:16S rRNA (guanine966-N2)-methyltransferase
LRPRLETNVHGFPPMRVIAGQYRSRRLLSLPGVDLRPTADKLRQTLFNVLTAGNPEALEGSVWLDLYAGTGAVGIEALSRGAAKVHFVESSAKAADLIRQNLKSLGVNSGAQVLSQNVSRSLRALEELGVVAGYVFLDPPYSMEEEYSQTLASLASSSLVQAQTIIVAEHEKRFDPGEAFADLRRYRKLVQGDAALSFYRRHTAGN